MLAPLSTWRRHGYLSTISFIWTSYRKFSFLQLKLGVSLFNLKTPLYSSVSSSCVTYQGLSFASTILLRCSDDGWHQWWMTLVRALHWAYLSYLAEPAPFLLTILSWDSYIIQLWTSPRFYSSAFFMLSLKSLKWLAENFESLLSEIHTIAQTLDFLAYTSSNVPKFTWQNRNSWGLFSQKFFSLHVLHELLITYLTRSCQSIIMSLFCIAEESSGAFPKFRLSSFMLNTHTYIV